MRTRVRLTDLPKMGWWGITLRLIKTLEVLFFKILQFLDLYRPQKSIIGIPSLATRSSTSLQAVVYNGTQEEVLGFRARRLVHRILRGLPDLEYFESIQFQVSVSQNALRTIEGSTEDRGFIHLQLPWQLPYQLPTIAWSRMDPKGIDTPFGRIRLGDYEVISSPVFFLHDGIHHIVVTDIDDTIKDSNVHESTKLKEIVRGLFRGNYYRFDAIPGMATLYQKLAARGCLIVYLTSTPYQLAPFLMKFLRDSGFPDGPVFPRWMGYGRFGHKWRTLHRLLTNAEKQKVYLIGDSGEQDLQIYRRVTSTPSFGSRVEKILIRHVPGTPLPRTLNDTEILYKDAAELEKFLAPVLVE
ncbi:MAG: DUF2183 domain-containing protein [Deltaproteobacteria bacterium]|nr:DUF2183 domain-containing protein [Deltaproteobacteria bacterium]MBI3295275.1 DUF2183 domain-containing protein [Deltaproteobacteria bacterium]